MHKLTGKQCRTARGLLKWNIYDLANRINGVNPKRIDSFERGMVHIAEWENDEMVTAFRKEGVTFNADLEVVLDTSNTSKSAIVAHMHGEGAHIKLDAEQNVVSDSTSAVVPVIGKEGAGESSPDDEA